MDTEVKVVEALDDIIAGRNVKRIVHDLNYDGRNLTGMFAARLKEAGFLETTVGEIEVGFNERIAAFLIRDSKAYFGWVFNERFTDKKSRKLFGSELRNRKGDWAIQIPSNSRETIFIDPSEKLGMEVDSSFVLE
jgi:hypothetical protein